ncbi:MAG: matrixin family metalloprotease [Candidatus Eisenbacteria bacterium]|uniref:Matrixin family metalloprotease n=1 Tax=Eiseniibacteriota bacterium TaxID=2212470 RepID=A0A948W5T7_UNCEI|nr:matrixin family metalloprotease [Candidatus Eisenbacteria bacterium]MBU1950022.1 matrixin family metalloprotease [Candidatus Eisenbacteria bacterium]MBU2689906.1 matrixin family metalloprotease [Candidatus Eisenbacteria bacterium]
MRRILCLGFLGILLASLTGTAWGYALFDPPMRVGDPDLPFVYTIHYDIDEPSIRDDHEFELIKQCFRNWGCTPGADLPFVEGPHSPICGIASNGVKTVSVQDCNNLCGSGVLGVTYRLRTAPSEGFWTTGTDTLFSALVESDFVYCRNFNWDDPAEDWHPCPGNRYDFEGVGTHEIGHMLGLDHSAYAAATMFYAIAPCDSTKSSLHFDDQRATRVLYREGRIYLGTGDHDNFNGSLTVTNCGNFGFTGSGGWNGQSGQWGSGFVYPSGGANTIFEASMAFGSTNGPVSDNFRSDVNPEDDDFIQTFPIQLRDLSGGEQTGFGIWDDSKNDETPYGVSTVFRSYSYPTNPDDDYVILMYWLVNESGSTISNFRAGIFVDFDLANYATNNVDYDADLGLGYVHDPSTTTEVGLAVLNPEGVSTFRAIHATTETYSDADKTAWLQSGLTQTSMASSDIAVLIATGTFTIAPGDSALAAFALVGGDGHTDIRANVAAAQVKYATLTKDPLISDVGNTSPTSRIDLAQNRPNPFGPSTQISFALQNRAGVSLIVTDPSGRLVRTLHSGDLDKGRHTFMWDGRDNRGNPVSTGMYFYSLKTPEGVQSRKMMLLK